MSVQSHSLMEILLQGAEHCGCLLLATEYSVTGGAMLALPILPGDVGALSDLVPSGAGLVHTALSAGARSAVDGIPGSGTAVRGAGTLGFYTQSQLLSKDLWNQPMLPPNTRDTLPAGVPFPSLDQGQNSLGAVLQKPVSGNIPIKPESVRFVGGRERT